MKSGFFLSLHLLDIQLPIRDSDTANNVDEYPSTDDNEDYKVKVHNDIHHGADIVFYGGIFNVIPDIDPAILCDQNEKRLKTQRQRAKVLW
eukprot:CAMPEP_0203760392 /NCGR_PEP_ID=MMETSP0098-20131031/13692_1 /ASSEMBLY_ACC=CAM_ASM_000208 /TAXON_ID=96639 /ORGANISM=" , Strain NY0313808BC1" /LENGTH=90 /DNA_ID=CAMNT_0050653925 /DNA_START=365 /DNA_END=634 /DNA_ORIENTATION=+